MQQGNLYSYKCLQIKKVFPSFLFYYLIHSPYNFFRPHLIILALTSRHTENPERLLASLTHVIDDCNLQTLADYATRSINGNFSLIFSYLSVNDNIYKIHFHSARRESCRDNKVQQLTKQQPLFVTKKNNKTQKGNGPL